MRRRRKEAIVALAAGVVLVAGCGGDSGQQASVASGCRVASEPRPQSDDLDPPPQTLRRGEKLTAVVETSCGTFDIALDTRRAPRTTSSFAFLARHGVYDGLAFHGISPSLIQAGDPSGSGTGGPGYRVDERPPPNLAYTRGVVAMAKTSAEPPGRSGSQFFIVVGADAGLPPVYALVGRVSRGFDVVRRIAALGTRGGRPTQTVLTEQVTIEGGEG
ncbi:MAG: peptidylprolyl isomerase [Solirubrobacterales bacterium]